MPDYVLNGEITFPSGRPLFRNGTVIMIMPRGVASVYDEARTLAPFIGKGAMGCCPDLTTSQCKRMIDNNEACPIKRKLDEKCGDPDNPNCWVVQSITPSISEHVEASKAIRDRCLGTAKNAIMCTELMDPPGNIGDIIDLMQHVREAPIPLKFMNIGEKPGATVCYRRSHSYYYRKYLYSNTPKTTPAVSAAMDEGFYIGKAMGKVNNAGPASPTNPIIVQDSISGEAVEVNPLACYVLDSWDSPVVGCWGDLCLQLGSRVMDKRDRCPCIIIAFNGRAGNDLRKVAKSAVTSITLLTDLEQVRVVTANEIALIPGLSVNSFLNTRTTAYRYNKDDIKHRYAYYYGISNDYVQHIDPMMIIHNAGAGADWQRVMEVYIDPTIPHNTADTARNLLKWDMHTYLGIKNDKHDSTNFYSTESARNAKFEQVSYIMGNQYILRWSGDYLEIKKGEGTGAKPSVDAQNQINMAAALETNSLKNDCEQSLGVTPDDNTENRCKSIAVDHIYGKIPTATVTTRQILESCNSDGQLMSRTCMEAARLSSREDVEALLGPAFTKYCTQIHPEDSRCVEGTAFTFVNTEQATSADFKAAYYHEYLWPIVMVVVCATVYCIQKTTTKTGKDRNFYFQVLACLGIGSLLSHMLLPTYTADAISGFKRNAFIS
ncbi:hypothetical protein EhV454 [Emiliania huxleyi virus 86]|uniref:Putative membrane protein n=1 Tax=Emiliania huxleyi virus 86 (isolate United Kingdom/English Channel/1999) TaxID=654925 RepID=Q4A225_EHV8U|nr:hypothetical protein EhV454 [Emiliania huxleyi virus 86]CAI65881.1 putative membrane protein [Emiliania huxleyi virus 86]